MKIWIEFPEETRFARQPRDILYTPIYFANEKISAHLRLDGDWQKTYGEHLDEQFNARIKLVGKASLGFLSIGGKPVNGHDMRYALPNLGFKPIYTLEILSIFKRLSLANLDYDADDGVRSGRTAFSFRLPTATLDDLQQLASSTKVITADTLSTMGFLKGITPALIVNVQYNLVAEILDKENHVKSMSSEEIRVFVSLTEEQVPAANDPALASNPMAKFVTTQVISFSTARNRRGSIPLLRRLSRTASQEPNLMTIDVEGAEPFTFTRHSDAAASKVTISFLYSTDNSSPTDTPPALSIGIQWMLKTLTTLTLEPLNREDDIERTDDYFHLRAKVLPSRKLKLQWSDWQQLPASDENRTRWKSTQAVWLVKDINAGLTPTFITPYLSHTYYLNLVVTAESEAKLDRGKQKVELDIPVQVRYDLGLVPSYEVDQTLPEYDHTLPEYEETEGENTVGEGVEAENLQGIEELNISVDQLPEEVADDALPVRRVPHLPHTQASTD